MTKILFLTLLLSFFCGLIAGEIYGRVIAVADGDTITIIDNNNTRFRVRLDRIDAPEKKQSFGNKAKQFLSEMIFGKQVKIEFKKRDRYGRILGVVYLDNSEINLIMVQQGMAWHYSYFDNTERYAVAEREARAKKIGLWCDPHPISPYQFRKAKRRQK